MKLAANISLVPEISQSPHFHGQDWAGLMERAAALGYDGIEIFPKSAEEFPVKRMKENLARHGLELCVLGSGAGKVLHNYTFTDPDAGIRGHAIDFVRALVEVAGEFGASVMVGSMQGKTHPEVPRQQAMEWLAEGLAHLANIAQRYRVGLVFEPINRYETDLVNTLGQGGELIRAKAGTADIRLVADLFHMNIEEADMAGAILEAGKNLGHFHLADTNRRAAGLGHMDYASIAQAMRTADYQGYLSVECFTGPDPEVALQGSKAVFDRYFKNQNL